MYSIFKFKDGYRGYGFEAEHKIFVHEKETALIESIEKFLNSESLKRLRDTGSAVHWEDLSVWEETIRKAVKTYDMDRSFTAFS